MRVLFICKRNEIYGNTVYTRRSSGLFNSTRFIVEALLPKGIHAHIIEVQDNNDIDREVSKFKPHLVIIEALWVVPEKFHVLKRLHPKVRWAIHLHSDMPFLALEGIAMDWTIKCARQGVTIIANSEESFEALKPIIAEHELVFLPNVYLGNPLRASRGQKHGVNVACFGAVRPLKNHLLQALAAIQFAKERCQPLRFHINVGRVETGGAPVLKNLRQLFNDTNGTKLVEHHWFEPEDFIYFLNTEIDIGLQVSLTETFNVVSADYVTAGLPIVVSKEVKWVSLFSRAIDNSLKDIVSKMHSNFNNLLLVKLNQFLLQRHSDHASVLWYEYVRHILEE